MPLILWLILSFILIEQYSGFVVISIILILLEFYRYKDKRYLLLIVVLILFFVKLDQFKPEPNFNQPFTVINQVNNYTTFKQGLNHFTGFTQEVLELGNKVNLEGYYVSSNQNHIFEALALKNTFQGLVIKDISIIETEFNLIKLINNNPIISKMILDTDLELDSSLLSLIMSSGVLLSSLFTEIKKWVQLILSPKQTNLVLVILVLIVSFLFGLKFILLRLLVKELLLLTKIKNPHRHLVEMSLMLFIYPFSYRHMAFLIPYSYKLSQFIFYDSKLLKLKQTILVTLIQLSTVFQANLIQTFLFNYFRLVSKWILLFALVLPNNILMTILFNIDKLQFMNYFNIVGKMPWFLSLMIISVFVFESDLKKQIFISLLSFFVFILMVHFNPLPQVIFLNVGQGDATLVISPYQKNVMLIDTGQPSSYYSLKKSLNQYGINKLDTLIITHHDNDHSGNLNHLKQDYEITKVIDQKNDLKQIKNIQPYLLNYHGDDENDNSLVFELKIGNESILFLGDISKHVERMILQEHQELSPQIVKLGHHGSRTSTDEYFISKIRPQFVVISSDPNAYGHPHFEVLETLRKYKIKTLKTFRDDNIRILFHPHRKIILTKHQFLIVDAIIGE